MTENRKRQRDRQFAHQGGMCCWCLEQMDSTPAGGYGKNPMSATWEHVIPKSLGGVNGRSNRVLAHKKCNLKRGNKIRTPHFKPYPGRGEIGNRTRVLASDQLSRSSSDTEGSNPSVPTTHELR